jgi:AcrR family transcriptional regulator
MATTTAGPGPARILLPRAERRESILAGAATAFAHTGFAATSMDDLATECGVSKLILYRHFDGKTELYHAILERVFERQVDEFLTLVAAEPGPGVAARSLLTVAREHPDGFRLLWRHAIREQEFADYASQLRDIAVGAAREVVANLGIAAPYREWAAQTLYDNVVDSVLNWLDHGDPSRDDEFVELTTESLRAAALALVR